jgi:phosphatidylglycerophosphatase A
MTRLAIMLSTCCYVGYFPVAPGTAGSAAALALFALMAWVAPAAPALYGLEAVVVLGLFFAGWWSGTVAERHLGTTDPGQVVLDEVVGMLLTLAFMPVGVKTALLGFVVFRLFDIIKPFPASRLERLHGGLGIMADDAMAGVYGNVVVRFAAWLLPGWLV